MVTAPDFLRGPLFVKWLQAEQRDALTPSASSGQALTLSQEERGFCRIRFEEGRTFWL